MNDAREFDIIVWGASGFTGQLVAEYLFNKYGSHRTIKWAMGGRNQSKLSQVRAAVADETVPLVIADSHDETSLNAMAQRTRVVPYGLMANMALNWSPPVWPIKPTIAI